MEFVLSDEPVTYWWPVTVNIPHPEKAGELQPQTLWVLFVAECQDAAVRRQEEFNKLSSIAERVEAEREHLLSSILNWRGVVGKDKAPVEFSRDNLRWALQHSWFRTGVYNAQTESLTGQAAAKN